MMMDDLDFIDDLADVARGRRFALASDDGREVAVRAGSLPEGRVAAVRRAVRPGDFPAPAGLALETVAIEGQRYHLILETKRGQPDPGPLVDRFRLLARAAAYRRLSVVDGATGLPNKRRLLAELDRRIGELITLRPRAAAIGLDQDPARDALSLVLLDIDKFKRFNDEHGHRTGDHVLALVADTLKARAAAAGFLPARYGGEEFVAVLAGVDEAGAFAFAETVRLAVAARPLAFEGRTIPPVHVSLGVTTLRPGAPGDPHFLRGRLIEEADTALYAAKEAGRNTTVRYSTLRDRGRVVESLGGDRCHVIPGPAQGARPGDRYRVVHRLADGQRQVIDPETGKPLGIAPVVIKGHFELIADDTGDAAGDRPANRFSLARAIDFAPGFAPEPGDRLERIATRIDLPVDDRFDAGLTLAPLPFTPLAEAVGRLPERGRFALIAVDRFAERLSADGRPPLAAALAAARADLAAAGYSLVALASDKALAWHPRGLGAGLDRLLGRHALRAILGRLPDDRAETPLRLLKAAFDTGLLAGLAKRRIDADDPLLVSLARALYDLGYPDAARLATERMADHACREYHNLIGALAFRAGDPAAAADAFAASTDLDPTDIRDWVNLGIAAMTADDAARGVPAFRRALDLDPDLPQANNNYADALLESGGDPARALAHARRALRSAPDRRRADLYEETVAHALLRLGRADEAIRLLAPLVVRRPDLACARARLAEAESALREGSRGERPPSAPPNPVRHPMEESTRVS